MEQEHEDREAGRSREEVTMRTLATMAGSIMKGLTFTYDYPDKERNSEKMPLLDCEVWWGRETRETGVPADQGKGGLKGQ